MNLDLHKELYFFEWSRKEQLARAANLPVALLTVLVGGVFYLLRSFPYGMDLATSAFLALAFASLAAVVAGISFVVRSSHGYWYQQIPPADRLQEFSEELKAWHEAVDSPSGEFQRDFDAYLQGRLAQATAANWANNTNAAAALDKASWSVVFALVFTGLSLVPYFPQSMSRQASSSLPEACSTLCGPKETHNAGATQDYADPAEAAAIPVPSAEARGPEERGDAEGRRDTRDEVGAGADPAPPGVAERPARQDQEELRPPGSGPPRSSAGSSDAPPASRQADLRREKPTELLLTVLGGFLAAAAYAGAGAAGRYLRRPYYIPFERDNWSADVKARLSGRAGLEAGAESTVWVINYDRHDYLARGASVVRVGGFKREVRAARKEGYAILMTRPGA